jgi:hypothetical protein
MLPAVGAGLPGRPIHGGIVDVIDVTERLMAEFEDRLDLSVISRVVSGCRRDLEGTPAGPMPELLERLARQRLLDVAGESRAKRQRSDADLSHSV